MFKLKRYKLAVCASVLVYLIYFLGITDYLNTKSFETDFDYPLNIDIRPVVENILSGIKPDVKPINNYPYKFLTNSGKCKTVGKLDLLIAVKSAMGNFYQRSAIRQTYGQEYIIPGTTIKTLFFLGVDTLPKSDVQKKIDKESAFHKDIIQADFQDSYFNNTIKTMMMFRWMYEHCGTSEFYLITDDDMYISVPNLLKYVHSTNITNSSPQNSKDLYAGYVFRSSPHRVRSSKWRISLDEYAWNKWPTYVTAGAYVVSNKYMRMLYIGSLFVKHFRFDDIYLGIVATKLGIEPTHCTQFYFYKKKYSEDGYKDVIASHGYGFYKELIEIWNLQHQQEGVQT